MQQQNLKVIDGFLLWLGASRTKATVSSYKYAFYALKKWLKANELLLTACTVEDIAKYLASLDAAGLKSGTRNIYATALRSMWSWLHKQGRVQWPPDLIPLPVREPESYPAATPEEVAAILGCFDENLPQDVRDKTGVMLLWKTGMRLGELLSLKMGSMDWEAKKGIVKTFKRKNHHRLIFWDDEMREMFDKWIQVRQSILHKKQIESDHLFISLATNSEEGPMARHALQRVIRTLRKHLGITKKLSPHTFRHGFGTEGVKNNVHMRDLQELLGHAKITTTQIYAQVSSERVESVWRSAYGKRLLPGK